MNNLKNLRLAKNLSLNELSEKIGIPYQTLRNYEIGKRTPKKDNVEKLADFYEVTPSYILGLSESKTDLNSDIKNEFLASISSDDLEKNRHDFIKEFSSLIEFIITDPQIQDYSKQEIFDSLYRNSLVIKKIAKREIEMRAMNDINKMVSNLVLEEKVTVDEFLKMQNTVNDRLATIYLNK